MSAAHPNFEVKTYADVAVVRLTERRYLSDSQSAFIDALRDAAEASTANKVVVDLGAAELLTSGPIGALVAMQRQIRARGGKIVAAGGGDFAVRVLSFAANILDHHETVESALRAPGMSPEAARVYSEEG